MGASGYIHGLPTDTLIHIMLYSFTTAAGKSAIAGQGAIASHRTSNQ